MSDGKVSSEMLERALSNVGFMATETFANANRSLIAEYAELRLHGIHPSVAFRRTFGEEFWDTFSQSRIYAVESSALYAKLFREKLTQTPIQQLWNERLAIHKLLAIANNVFEKGSTQLRAIQELNVLIGVTIVDETGKTRKGNKMSDFYNDIGTEDKRGQANNAGSGNKG